MYRVSQAIKTKYLGPTNYRGARIKASCNAMSIIVDWDYDLYIDDNHTLAAKILAEKLYATHGQGWAGYYFAGSQDEGYYFVNSDLPPNILSQSQVAFGIGDGYNKDMEDSEGC